MTQQPSIGRIVHYRSYGTPGGEYAPACRAAVVTDVHSLEAQGITDAMLADREVAELLPSQPVVSLCVLNPTGLFFDQYLPYDADAALGGTWHWPERTDFPLPTEYSTEGLNPPPTLIPRPDREPGPDVP